MIFVWGLYIDQGGGSPSLRVSSWGREEGEGGHGGLAGQAEGRTGERRGRAEARAWWADRWPRVKHDRPPRGDRPGRERLPDTLSPPQVYGHLNQGARIRMTTRNKSIC